MKTKIVTSPSRLPFIIIVILTTLFLASCMTTTVTITLSAGPYIINQPIIINVTVAPGGTNNSSPTGRVEIWGCSVSGEELVNGEASCNVVFNSIGNKTITAKYWGDDNYTESEASINLTVEEDNLENALPTPLAAISITGIDPAAPNLGQSITVNVQVSGNNSTPTGTVNVTKDSSTESLCIGNVVSDGTASCVIASSSYVSVGSKNIKATYSGDSTYNPISSNPFVFNLGETQEEMTVPEPILPSTTTIVQTIPTEGKVNKWVTVVVTVTLPDGSTPDGSVKITGADTTCTIDLTAGDDRCSVKFTSKGNKTLQATYGGATDVSGSQDTHAVNIIKEIRPTPTEDT